MAFSNCFLVMSPKISFSDWFLVTFLTLRINCLTTKNHTVKWSRIFNSLLDVIIVFCWKISFFDIRTLIKKKFKICEFRDICITLDNIANNKWTGYFFNLRESRRNPETFKPLNFFIWSTERLTLSILLKIN